MRSFAVAAQDDVTALSPPYPSFLRARWLFLRALGAIFFSAFYALWFQIDGLIGPTGILPVADFLSMAKKAVGVRACWYVPSLLWINTSRAALQTLVCVGLTASVALALNLWPRLSIAIAFICFLSFVSAAQEFSSYQSDSMLLEAAFLSLFFAPRGARPGLGSSQPPSHASLFMLRFEWFRIYFESGLVKLLSGEPQWRDLTAMNKYYENGPLPTWLGWYVQQWPERFHVGTAAATLIIELFVAWLIFYPRWQARLVGFVIATLLQIGIILTANYAFLNYLVLSLGFLMLDDRLMGDTRSPGAKPARWSRITAVVFPIHLAATVGGFLFARLPPLNLAAVALEPFRIANNYGLFAVMTRGRYEIEFQGTHDGEHWIAYPFRYKPQSLRAPPGIYAPYQPRFDWNLWFASLGAPEQNPWVMNVQARLLDNEPAVLRLFDSNPFRDTPPIAVRAVLWQYWFTTRVERARTGNWWRRELRGPYGPTGQRGAGGAIEFVSEGGAREP